jgi:hypothetical protein
VDHGHELAAVADLFEGARAIRVGDIVQELRSSGICNPANVMRTRSLLIERGATIVD